ncbi:MAG: putative transposase, partial [Bacteroidia bacterium]
TYRRHRFPPDIISYAVWLYYRFNLSHRDIEDLLAERGITVSREVIRLWCIKLGAIYTRRLKRKHRGEPHKIVTDKLRSYGVAHRELTPEAINSTKQYENNRAEQSHEATRVRERVMRKFKSVKQAQRFLGVSMLRLPIYSIWAGTRSTLNTIGISGYVRLLIGIGQLLES